MTPETVDALKEVDRFHKNCRLLFNDMVASIEQKTLTETRANVLSPEGRYDVSSANISEHRCGYIFNHDGRLRFVFMLVKTQEDQIASDKSPGFRAMCQALKVDMVFPFLLVTGIFEPRSVDLASSSIYLRRHWLESTVMLNVPEPVYLTEPSTYSFDKVITITSPVGNPSWHCEHALFRIRWLSHITNSNEVETVVDELLTF
jgi:hypothetical protein